jgi:beta-lactam-binding protein with PASTA domain
MTDFSAPDVLGLPENEALVLLKQYGYAITDVEITMSSKEGQPEGGCRVVRQRTSGQEIQLILAFEKWVCSRKEV